MPSSKREWRRRIGRVTAYQRGQRYWIYYRQGRQIRQPVGTDRDEALTLAAKINAQLAEGAPTALAFQPINVDVLIDKWLDHHEQIRRSSVTTVSRYRTAVAHLKRFVQSLRGGLRAHRFDASMAEDFVRYLRTSEVSPNGHKNAKKRAMRDKGVIFVLEACRALFNFARNQRHLPAYAPNPFTGLSIDRMPIEDAKPIRPLTPEQEVAFFKACDEWQFRVFFLLAFTGLRVGELVHLLIDNDVRLDENLMRITNKPRLYWQVKTRNLRDVPLLPEVARVLRVCVGDRKAGPVIQQRRYALGKAIPALTGRTMVELEDEVRRRIEAHQDKQQAGTSRIELARIGRTVWSDAGATKETKIRSEFMRITGRIGLNKST